MIDRPRNHKKEIAKMNIRIKKNKKLQKNLRKSNNKIALALK